MRRKGRKISAPTIILLTVLLVVAGIAMFNYFATRGVQSSNITLPKEADAPAVISGQPENYITVTTENLSEVVASLHRPNIYHQSFTSVSDDGQVQNQTSVELWVRNDVVLVSDTSSDSTRHILSNGTVAFIWYDSNPRGVAQTALPEDVSLDDLVGLPTYETILNLSQTSILETGYTQLAAPLDNPCIYAHIQKGNVGTETLWIDTASGLLCRAEYEKDGVIFGTVEQTELEIIDSDDSSIRSLFYLPDGSEPFPFSVETEMPQA